MTRARLALPLFVGVWIASAGAHGASAQGECVGQHEQTQLVRSGEVVRPYRVEAAVGGKILRLRLCREARGLVWRVRVLAPDGRVRMHVVDARSGRPLR